MPPTTKCWRTNTSLQDPDAGALSAVEAPAGGGAGAGRGNASRTGTFRRTRGAARRSWPSSPPWMWGATSGDDDDDDDPLIVCGPIGS